MLEMMGQMGNDIKNIIKSCQELAWYYRGGISYHDFMQMTAGERSLAAEFINHRMEKIVPKSQTPVY